MVKLNTKQTVPSYEASWWVWAVLAIATLMGGARFLLNAARTEFHRDML